VDAVLPAEAQFGDAVQVIGDGFGLGSPATVTLRGDVFRTGRAPEPVEVTLRAQTESQRELTLLLPREAENAFCGDPERASHATFRGDVQVAIAARSPGAPPATGSLHGVVLELYPAVKSQGAQDQQATRGRDMLQFLGIDVVAAREGGLTVTEVQAGSRAAAADVRPGDRLLRAGGLSVLQPSDLVPAAARDMELGVLRDELELTLFITVDGFTPEPPDAVAWAAVPIFAAALYFAGAASPLTRLSGWLAQSWVVQQQARRRARRRGAASAAVADGPHWIDLAGGASGILVWLGVAAALCAPLLRRVPVDVSSGLLVVMFIAAAVLGALAFLGAETASERWSLRRGLAAAYRQWFTTAPAWLGVLAAYFEGGVGLDDAARAQGGWPWLWNAFRTPGLFIACSAVLVTTIPRPGKSVWRLAQARPPRLSWRSDGDGWFDRLYICSTSALVTTLFLGGDAVPGLAREGAGVYALATCAAVMLLKYTLVVLAAVFVRGLFLGVTPGQWWRIGASRCLPLGLAALVVAPLWRSLVQTSALAGWAARGLAPAGVIALVLGLAFWAWRSYVAGREPGPPSLSPWL
jgi:hypothetical protein